MTATHPPMTGPMRSTKALPASNLHQHGRQRRQVNILADHPPTTRRRGDHMGRLGRRTSWLGWVVAGVLLVSAGGAALAAQDATTTTQSPAASGDKAKARTGAFGHRSGWRHAIGRRVLHGEVTLQTREGIKTLIMAYGQVTALSRDAITIRSSDGVETSFGIDGDTRFGFHNQPTPSAELKVGEDAFVAGEKSSDRATARRVVSGELARRGAGAAGGKATP
jgi:hypothetical protein